MNRMKTAAAVLGAMLVATEARAGMFDKPAIPKVGERAPDFQATLYDGRRISLADYRGKVLVVNFWATWCVPCRAELPLLDLYYRQRKEVGLGLVALAADDTITPSQLRPVREAMSFPMALRFSGPYRQMEGVPTNFVIDRAGIVRYAQAGAFTLAEMNKLLTPLLNEKAPEAPITTAALSAAPPAR